MTSPPVSKAFGPVVSLEGVSKSYWHSDHRIEALSEVNLHVEPGSIHGIIGFSGAGKSTLLRCISRIEKPDAGRVLIDGRDLAHLEGAPLREARRRIGIVFQQLHLLRSRTVAENVALPLVLSHRPKREIAERVAELLDWFGLADRANQFPSWLSGGQRQRVAIARAIAMRPAVLLTDEPTSSLDPETTASVLSLLRRIRDDFAVTILLVTHEIDAVRAIGDRVSILENGRIVEEGSVSEVLVSPRSSAARRLLL
jgi:D-methionine transport system ATP-binding protein